MLIASKEVERFAALVRDIRSGLLPLDLADSALLAFFVENPHLLMIEKFDEHMQKPLSAFQAEVLFRVPEDHPVVDALSDEYHLDLPHLEFRTCAGRWAGLIGIPPLYDRAEAEDPAFLFSYTSRQVLKQATKRWRSLEILDDLEDKAASDTKYREDRDELRETLRSDVVPVSVEQLVSDLQDRVHRSRESTSILWSPKLWTPHEQARQRALLDASLLPHLERWRTSGVCFEDLNPSEFEDLVGGVLFAAGLKIYKVREVPQGGRDLIARGTLIPDEEPIEMAVEVKHRRVVDRPEVQLALYQNRAYPALLFVTSGRFTSGVFKEKGDNRFRLFLKDGLAVGDLVRSHFRLDAEIRPSRVAGRK
ncbi:MAG TPA: restriction endonuclease [Bryobacteraceae bacterium]|nr:restriction endonuclease [Bryobacteraceae bacterium]